MPRSHVVNDPQAIVQGQSIFVSQGCQTCHGPMEKNSHGRGTSFDTPSLGGIWSTAPYFHDGSAATLAEVLRSGTEHDILDELD